MNGPKSLNSIVLEKEEEEKNLVEKTKYIYICLPL